MTCDFCILLVKNYYEQYAVLTSLLHYDIVFCFIHFQEERIQGEAPGGASKPFYCPPTSTDSFCQWS